MVTALLRIAPLALAAAIDPVRLRQLLWEARGPNDRLEHVYIRAGPHGQADILAFIDTTDPQQADHILYRLVQQAIAHQPLLHMWRVV